MSGHFRPGTLPHHMTTMTTTTPRLYVGTYGKYNAGSIAGAWLDLEDYADREDFLTACRALHADESDPELMFQDVEGIPSPWYCESSAPPAELWEWLALSTDEREAFALWADYYGDGPTVDQFRDRYAGSADSEADFAEIMANQWGDITADFPTWLCIDWQRTWASWFFYDYYSARSTNGTFHFFRR